MEMKIAAVIATLLSVIGGLDLAEAQRCSIRINGDLADRQPLVMWPGVGAGFAYPQSRGTGSIVLSAGQSLRLVCLGTGNAFAVDGLRSVSDVRATCVQDLTFSFDGFGITEDFRNIACLDYPAYAVRRIGDACLNGLGERCEIGFNFGAKDFQSMIELCHNDVNHNTILAHSKMLAVIDAAQTSFRRTSFAKGGFYKGVSMNNVYNVSNQLATLGEILGSEEWASTYMSSKNSRASGKLDLYLARGHLVAKTDLIYGSQQRSTFFYLNTVPMWQSVNSGNWARMEAGVKRLAISRNLDLDVYTGSMGVLTLADVDGVQRQVYLSVDGNKKSVPVPKLLFKVVYARAIGQGIVFVTANNPHLTHLTSDYVKCTDVCDRIKSYRLTWKPKVSKAGLSYCCKIGDFRQVFRDLPSFPPTQLLI